MKSSRPAIGPVEVLEHEDRRARLGERSKNVRQAPNSCSRAGRCPSTTQQRQQRRTRSTRDRASGTCSATIAAIPARVVGLVVGSSARPARRRTISPRAQNVIPSPYDGERPRCQ